MELIGAGLHGEVEVSAAYLSVFRREVAGLNRDLLDRVHAAGLAVLLDDLPDGSGGILAVDVDGFAVARHAVHDQRLVVAETHARKQARYSQRIPKVSHGGCP